MTFTVELVLAMLFMALLGGIPRRYWFVQLPAVLGWALVWGDSAFTGQWTDSLGLTLTIGALLYLAAIGERDDGVTGGASTRRVDTER